MLAISITTLLCGMMNCPNAQACDATSAAAPAETQIVNAAFSQSAGTANTANVYDFDGRYDHRDWRVVVDGVMGGLSTGRKIVNKEGIMVFSGELSTKNNGGFSALRSPGDDFDFGGADGFIARVRGDGRTYRFDALIADNAVGRTYNSRSERWRVWQEFTTVDGQWIEVALPFADFSEPTMFGTEFPDGKDLDPTMIRRIGFMVADKINAPFKLEVDWVRTYAGTAPTTTNARLAGVLSKLNLDEPAATAEVPATSGRTAERLARVAAKLQANEAAVTTAAASVTMTVESYIIAAIDRGVPLFNNDQPGACAAVYETAAAGLVTFANDTLTSDQRDRLTTSLTSLPRDPSERAWILRRAFDDVLRMEMNRQVASRH